MRTLDDSAAVLRRLLLTTAQAWQLPPLRVHRPVSELAPRHRWPSSLAHIFHPSALPRATSHHENPLVHSHPR